MTEHAMATTTRTTELRQIHEMNTALAGGSRLTAAALGLPAGLPEDAMLCRLRAAGPPSYPYVYGVFTRDRAAPDLTVELHTAQLRAISDRLHLRRHIWGV